MGAEFRTGRWRGRFLCTAHVCTCAWDDDLSLTFAGGAISGSGTGVVALAGEYDDATRRATVRVSRDNGSCETWEGGLDEQSLWGTWFDTAPMRGDPRLHAGVFRIWPDGGTDEGALDLEGEEFVGGGRVAR